MTFGNIARDVQQAIINFVNISADEIEDDESVLSCKTVTVNTVKYAIEVCFIVDVVDIEQFPVFFKIDNMLNFRSKWLLYGSIYKCHAFNTNMHAFEVKSINVWCILESGCEIDYHALDLYSVEGKQVVILHHKPYKT